MRIPGSNHEALNFLEHILQPILSKIWLTRAPISEGPLKDWSYLPHLEEIKRDKTLKHCRKAAKQNSQSYTQRRKPSTSRDGFTCLWVSVS